jgi:hypothetical protein
MLTAGPLSRSKFKETPTGQVSKKPLNVGVVVSLLLAESAPRL